MSSQKLRVPKKQPNSFYIETYGCQMNEYDSLIARKILEETGGQIVSEPSDAELILLNTCAIRENAHVKVYNRLRQMQNLQKKGAKIGILGCMAQNLREELLYENLPVDFVMGPDELRNLPKFLSNLEQEAAEFQKAYLHLSRTETYDDVIPNVEHHLSSQRNSVTAFVTIQRGCDNFCAFCVVPYTRGRERSRPPESIKLEIDTLHASGMQSVVLLGQNVNSYNFENYRFTDLIRYLLEHTKIPRIYFTSPHPKDFPLELIELMASNPRFCNSVHMPLQSGSNEVLRNMKRNYTAQNFLELVREFREKVPDVAISTDVIVGFPGETEAQFQETMDVMQEAEFDTAFMFAYSKRKGTIAARRYEDDVTADQKSSRLSRLIDAQMQRSLKMNERFIGRTVNVLVESVSRRSEDHLTGRMTNGKKVIFPVPDAVENADTLTGEMIDVKIEKTTAMSLLGKAVIINSAGVNE
ncbi:MAG: tRNA (N6-isopentenyl adenosine(37)-C2)-methylthiotransferase MiaB [Leptospiraceae bacterium]|nr:tRNA (N6-isopentenyl adenosine(37)-C2)-methylthiotransferase MiaB [Leptospiraceae bacterium]